jgi:hypothetical protein
MAESSLSLSRDDIRKRVAHYLGYGIVVANWTDKQQFVIDDICLKSGLRRAYHPEGGYEWSFLRPKLELTLASGTDDTKLPDDFGGLIGGLYYDGDESRPGQPIRIVGVGEILQSRQDCPDASGAPNMAALNPRSGTSTQAGQRWELMVHPTPDEAYVVRGQYFLLGSALSESNPHPYGGAAFAEVIITACLAAAERQADVIDGPQEMAFRAALAAAMLNDQKNKPQNFGYNRDESDGPVLRGRHIGNYTVLVNGVEYD